MYKDNKESRLVMLYTGETARINDCVKTGEGHWALKIDKQIILSEFDNLYYLIRNCHNYIVSFKNDKPNSNGHISCLFSPKLVRFYLDISFKPFLCTYESLPKEYYTEDLTSGDFYNNTIPKNLWLKKLKVIYRRVNNSRYEPTGDFKYDQLMGLKSATNRLTEGKQYKFGIELETMYGYLPPYLDNYLNYDAVHDGSLREGGPGGADPIGGEYVTGVLQGDAGFLQLKRLCNELTLRCKGGHLAGMHLHVGNVEFSKENIVFLYILYKKLENEIFSLLPKSRGKNEYCRKLPSGININIDKSILKESQLYKEFIENKYLEIFNFVSSTNSLPSYQYNKQTDHPLGKKCGYNHASSRYCWLNFVPAIFDTKHNIKSKTIEIRNHSYTTNYKKVKNWTLIHMGIIWFVENNKKEIILNENLNLNSIMISAYPRKASFLCDYIHNRKELFKTNTLDNEKIVEQNDYDEIVDSPELNLKSLV